MVKASFVTGFPWESEKELRQTIDFAKEINPEIVFFTTLNPFPGTYIWEQYFKEDPGLFAEGHSQESFIIHGADPVIRTKYLTAEEIEYWNGRAYLEFYLRPKYILKRLRQVRNLTELKRNFLSGNSLLKLALKRVFMKKPKRGEQNKEPICKQEEMISISSCSTNSSAIVAQEEPNKLRVIR